MAYSSKNLRKILGIMTALLGTLAFLLTTNAGAREVKLAHLAPTDDPRHESLTQFADLVKEKTNGSITIKIFPNSTLGKDREIFEQLQSGITELALNGGVLTNFYKQWSIINMPYLWRDQAAIREFLAGDTGKKWVDEMEGQTGVRILAFYDRNPRILTTKPKAITKVEDLSGLKVRVPKIDSYLDTWRAFGVQPVPMSASEFYMGLKLGTIDGMENPIEVMYHWKIYEVSKYLSMTNHMREVLFLTASKKFLDSITPEEWKAIQESASDSALLHTQKAEKDSNELVAKLTEKGMIINDPDLSGFKAKAKEVHEKYMNEFGKDVYEMVMEKYSN